MWLIARAGLHVALMLLTTTCTHSNGAVSNAPAVSPDVLYAVNGSVANFTCSAGSDLEHAYWLINGDAVNGEHTKEQQEYEGEGYTFTQPQPNRLLATIPAHEGTNNTAIQCRELSLGYSNNATLIVIYPEPPLAPTIFIENTTSSSIALRLWQPFLWPEPDTYFPQVTHYNITVVVTGGEGEVIEDSRNVSYTSSPSTWDYTARGGLEGRGCPTVSVRVTAVNEYGRSTPANITEGLPQALGLFPQEAVVTSTYFSSNGTPIVTFTIHPPVICSYQQFNYSLIVEGGRNGAREEVYRIGPKPGRPNDVIQETISSGLQRNAEYAVRIVVDTESGSTTSDEYFFDTHLYLEGQTSLSILPNCSFNEKVIYISVMGVSIGLSTFILLSVILAVVGCIMCGQCGHRDNSKHNQTNKPLSSMVDNPIYDGPIYDSVLQDFDTLHTTTAEAAAQLAVADTGTAPPRETQRGDKQTPDNSPPRYLDEPIQPGSSSITAHSSASPHGVGAATARSASVSIPSSKRTPQERNKLQLTLSLTNTSSLPPGRAIGERKYRHTVQPTPPKPIPTAVCNGDENYTIMSPAGTRTYLGSLEAGWGELTPEDTEKYRE